MLAGYLPFCFPSDFALFVFGTEDRAAERDDAAAWDACFLAATAFDDVLRETGSPTAELVKLMAQLAPAERGSPPIARLRETPWWS